MKKQYTVFALLLSVAALALGVSLVSVTPAAATQAYARQTGKACGYCHVDPAGDGTLTAAGRAFRANGNVLSTPTTIGGSTVTTLRPTATTVGPTTSVDDDHSDGDDDVISVGNHSDGDDDDITSDGNHADGDEDVTSVSDHGNGDEDVTSVESETAER